MIKNLSLLIVLLVLLTACSKEKETPNGMKFKVLKKGDGQLPKTGDVLVFDYSLKDEKDSTWTNTWEEGVPAASQIGDSSRIPHEDGMTQMFRMLSKGDSVTTSMSLGRFFKNIVRAPAPPTLDSNKVLTYTLTAQEITTEEGYFQSREPKVFNRDNKNIGKFVEKNKLTTQKDTSGLQYIIYSNTGGAKPKLGDCIEVKYLARFMRNGRVFDGAEKAAFPLNKDLVRGWQIGLPLMGEGDSATFFLPSRLGYGQRGSQGVVPPDAILIFDVKLLGVKKEFDEKTRTCK
jgi:FKBP-type peptidyl-prolyl cis-trans isomerase FkpA